MSMRQPAVEADNTKVAIADDVADDQHRPRFTAPSPIETRNELRAEVGRHVFQGGGKRMRLAASFGFLPRDDVITETYRQAEHFIDKFCATIGPLTFEDVVNVEPRHH